MNDGPGSRVLEIDGETVVFEIDVANNVAMGRIPTLQPFFGYRVLRDGETVREGVLTNDVHYPGTVGEQFNDRQLELLYRTASERT